LSSKAKNKLFWFFGVGFAFPQKPYVPNLRLAFFQLANNGLNYFYLRGLSIKFASKHQVENFERISKVGENKQLFIAIVVHSFFKSLLLFVLL
jgi:hypothetical protein